MGERTASQGSVATMAALQRLSPGRRAGWTKSTGDLDGIHLQLVLEQAVPAWLKKGCLFSSLQICCNYRTSLPARTVILESKSGQGYLFSEVGCWPDQEERPDPRGCLAMGHRLLASDLRIPYQSNPGLCQHHDAFPGAAWLQKGP